MHNKMAWLLEVLVAVLCLGLHSGAHQAGDGIRAGLQDLCNSSESLDHRTLQLIDSHYSVPSGTECRVENVQNLTVIGKASQTTIECIRNPDNITSSFFSFVNVTSLRIENIHFVGCGASLKSEDLQYMSYTSYFDVGQAAVLLCNHCFDLFIGNVCFSNNTGYSFVAINLHGNSTLDRIQVLGEDDTHYSPDDPQCTQPGYENVCNSRGMLLFFTDSTLQPWPRISPAQVVLSNSVFRSNALQWSNVSSNNSHVRCVLDTFDTFIVPWKDQVPSTLPDVGALTIAYTQTQGFQADVSVSNSNFTDNHGLCFGAIFVLMHTSLVNLARLSIQDSYFLRNFPVAVPENEAKNYFGGDVTIYMQYGGPYNESQCISITNSSVADSFTSTSTLTSPSISVIHFPNTQGMCIVNLQELSTTTSKKFLFFSGIVRGDTLQVMIQDIRMKAKDTRYGLKGLDLNDGLLMFVSVINVTINGTSLEKCQFNNLLGPVIIVRSSLLYLTGTMLFSNIHASTWAYGAAIQLQSVAKLWFQEPLYAEFCNNSAVAGGAISSVQLVVEFCVFQYNTQRRYTEQNLTEIDIHVVFTDNVATVAGNSMYVEGLYSCSTRLSPSLVGPVDVQKIYDAVFDFNATVNNGLQEMSSTPKEICLCESNPAKVGNFSLNCARDSLLNVPHFTTYPGKDFTVSVMSVDEGYHPVYSTMYNRLLPKGGDSNDYDYTGNFRWRLSFGLDIVKVLPYTCMPVNFSILTNSSEYLSEYSEGILSMYPFGQVDCLAVPVVMKECPCGFKLDQSEGRCTCSTLLRKHGFRCDINTGITRPYGENWVGVVSNSTEEGGNWSTSEVEIGYSTDCPAQYCSETLQVDLDNSSTVCKFGRVGVLCGRCPEGLSTVIGSAECMKCSNLWLLIIPIFALAGIVLVCLLFLLRLTVATGTINGLILYANIYNLSTHHLLDYKSTLWLSVFINMLNLKLGVPLCLYDGLTTLIATYMSFIVPIYLWFIVLVIIILSRNFQAVAKLTSRSAIPVLATIVHLSFSKLLSFVVNALSVIYLEVENNFGNTSHRNVWYFDGSVEYLSKYHVGLFCLSLISLVFFLLPYTIFLTGIKWFARFRFANHVRPFVDAFCAPYKDKWRFWFGARLWVLVAFYIWSVSLRNHYNTLILIKTISIVIFTVTQVAIMPYKNTLVNYLDIFFLVDLILLYVTLMYGEHFEASSNALVIPVFLAFCFIIAYHVYLVTGRNQNVRKMIRKMNRSVEMYEDLDSSLVSEDSQEERVSEKSSLNSPKGGPATYSTLAVNESEPRNVYHYRPGELREPLLETDSESNS